LRRDLKDLHVLNSEGQLLAAYERSGLRTMIPQEIIDSDDYIRCV
jgi:hypothetical protein